MKKISDVSGNFSGGRRLIFCMALVSAFIIQVDFARAEDFFNFAEYKLGTHLKIPKDEGQKTEVSGESGLRLSFRDADLRGYGDFSESSSVWEEPRLGAGIFLFKKSFPTSIKIGHNSYSKSLSKMKNPSPPTVINPLAKSFSFAAGCGAALPTLSSTRQPLSCSLSLKPDEKFFPVQLAAESFLNEDKEGGVFVSAKYELGRNIIVQPALSCARFLLEGKSTVLKKNNADFDADYFYSGLAEFSFHSPLVKVNFFSGIQESPYEVNPFWFRIDGRTSFKSFLLGFSYFAIPTAKDSPKAAPLIGGSSSVCRIVEQASMNSQVLFLFDDKNASSMRIGFSALENWKVTPTNLPVQLNTAKIRAAASYENRFLELRFDWTHANILISGEPPTKSSRPEEYHSFGLSSSFAGNLARFSISGSYAKYPPQYVSSALKEIYSADLKIGIPAISLTGKGGVDLTMKNGELYAGEFSAGALWSIRRKFLRASIKVELQVPF